MIDLSILQKRAEMLASCRSFFSQRNILEVDTPALTPYAPIALNIDVIPAQVTPTEIGYLHTSPEHLMKRLLAHGAPDIYYLAHVYRQSEIGRLHNPEFTMAEWYRLSFNLEQMIEETAQFLHLFLGPLPLETISYRDAFKKYLDLNYSEDSIEKLIDTALRFSPSPDVHNWDRDTLIHFLLTHAIEPQLGIGMLTALTDYPPHEAALACVKEKNNELVAERFELYYEGIELANGYHELPDATELRKRFEADNLARLSIGKPAYPLDEPFLASLSKLPPCSGVAVGFDRAFLLKNKIDSLSKAIPFCWQSN